MSRTGIATICLLLSFSVRAQSPQACSAMLDAVLEGVDMRVTAAEHRVDHSIRAGQFGPQLTLPAHCHVEGEIDRRTGADGKSYALRFAINLPDDWNGRFMFQGGGGLNGTLADPVGTQATGGEPALSRGFAVVSTDSGHEAQGPFDGSFMADQEAMLNFLFLGNMRVTRVAKPLVESYYRDGIEHSYFVGCSTGGREGMIMAQRYPLLYDGIVSGAPAIRTGHSNLGLRWINVNLNRVAPQDSEGVPQLDQVFSAAERQLVIDGFLASCDALDGAEDGLVFDIPSCDFDVRALACDGSGGDACLAPEKAEALATALAGPVDSNGEQVYSAFLVDTGLDDNQGFLPGLLVRGGTPPEGPSTAARTSMDVDAEHIEVSRFDNALGDSVSFRLSSFIANGGKQIFYHGVSDPWFSALDTLWYYENMGAANVELAAVNDYSRLFMVPGMAHCAGGERTLDSFDMLDAIVDWVEQGEAPEAITATGSSMPGVSRPLCPWPQHPHYDGSGDVNDAGNFQCRNP